MRAFRRYPSPSQPKGVAEARAEGPELEGPACGHVIASAETFGELRSGSGSAASLAQDDGVVVTLELAIVGETVEISL